MGFDSTNIPEDVTEILNALLAGARQILKGDLAAVYLRGSLAHGSFRPETSDVDVLAVTNAPVADAEFGALAALHAKLDALPNPYAGRIEIAYIDRAALKRFRPGLRHPTLGQGETLTRSEHHSNWILERWTVREQGVALLGPNPRTLIDPISPDELQAAVRARLGDWAEWSRTQDDPEWLAPRRAQAAYVVETMCRALHTLACGELTSKARAVAWALEELPEPWRSTVELSQKWRTDNATDPGIVPEVMRFVLWAASCPHMDEVLIFGSQEPDVQYAERRAAYVVIKEGDFVATVRPREKHFLPGGGSLPEEAPEDTIVREVREELARGVRLSGEIGEAVQYFYSEADERHYRMHATFFVGEFTGEASATRGEDELRWLSVAEAEQSFFHECHAWAVVSEGKSRTTISNRDT